MKFSKKLLAMLACPQCKKGIQLNEKLDGLICSHCALLYPIRENIPVMLIDEAIRLG